MNKPIRIVSVLCLVLFLALLLNSTYLMYVRADELNHHAGNRRAVVAAFSQDRGPIVVGRKPVALSVPVDDQYQYQRKYPVPRRYAHVTGFFSYFSMTAIERSQNEILSGQDSRFFVNRLLELIGSGSPEGGSVKLTIQRDVQNAAWQALNALGPRTEGAVVALEPDTGRVLAMVSLPSYDPNKLASHNLEKVLERYQQLESDPDQPLLNRAIQKTLPPGSTFKIVTAAAALRIGLYHDAESLVPAGYAYELPNTETVVRNYDGSNCGGQRITFTRAMKVSCNVAFLKIAHKVGTEAMLETAEAFGFNSTYLEALPKVQPSRYPASMNAPETALSGIGQADVTATPLQMAMVVAGIANNGVVMQPYIVAEVRSPDLEVIERTEPEPLSRAVSPRIADEITEMLVATVDTGTANEAQIPGIKVAGKTGTAEAAGPEGPYAWFVAFAPAEDPEVAVAVLVESTDLPDEQVSGGALGGPIAKAVIQAAINP